MRKKKKKKAKRARRASKVAPKRAGRNLRLRGAEAKEYPNQSERGKCELQLDSNDKLYCVQLDGCKGECILYSVPKGSPEGKWRPEKQPADPDPKRYYFCRCLEL